MIVLVIYSAWVSLFEFGFLEKAIRGLAIADNVINGFFGIDIVLTFFVAYMDKITYIFIDDRKKIAWKYATSWLILDVASTIPSELYSKIMPNKLKTYAFFNMLRLWRLRRVSALFARYINSSTTWIDSTSTTCTQCQLWNGQIGEGPKSQLFLGSIFQAYFCEYSFIHPSHSNAHLGISTQSTAY